MSGSAICLIFNRAFRRRYGRGNRADSEIAVGESVRARKLAAEVKPTNVSTSPSMSTI
jgi:hypothetical protein